MSGDRTDISDVEWEIVARRTFYECLVSSSPSSSLSSLASLSSTRSRVDVKTLIDHIRNNAWDNYRNKPLLNELQKSIEEVSCDGWINYKLFKKASRRWISKIQRRRTQDGNNNTPKDDSRSDDDKQNSVDSIDNDRDFENHGERCPQSRIARRYLSADFVDLLNVSSYSPSSDTTHGCAMSDTTPDDPDSGCGIAGGICDVSHVDLRLRVRQFDEENALLREDLVRAEEHAAGLQRQLDNLQRKFDHTKEKCRQLERENDERQEIMNEAERKERDIRMAFQKAEKERGALAKKVEHVEMERQQVALLKSKLESCKKEKYNAIKQANTCQWELESKRREFELLKEQLAEMTEAHNKIEESYEKTIERLRHELKNIQRKKLLLHTPDIVGRPSDNIDSTSAIGCFHPHIQSTPYVNNANVAMHDTLYDELKASGFSSMNETRIRELEDDLSWYNDEIRHAIGKINDIIEQLCHKRSTFHVPELHLDDAGDDKTSAISWLLNKISELSNVMNEIISKPKVKDASSQLCADLEFTNERLFGQYGIQSFADRLNFVSEKSECKAARKEEANVGSERNVFAEAFSMNSRLLGEYVEQVEIAHEADGYPDTDTFIPSSKVSTSAPQENQEYNIIDPIVEELDRIIQCTNNNKCEEETPLNSSPSKNPRYRSIYTCAEPSSDRRTIQVDDSIIDSSLNSPKRVQCNFAATYIVSSGGDGLPLGTINHTISNVDNTEERDSMLKTISLNDSNTFDGDSVRESMPDSRSLESTKTFDNETIPEEFVDSELRESKSRLKNHDARIPVGTLERDLTVSGKINEPSMTDQMNSSNLTEHCATPKTTSRDFPKRKISVFHRSFDIDSTQGDGEGGGSDTYRLTERSMSIPNEEKNSDNTDPVCMKMTPNTRKFLLNYRTNKSDSDSSDGLSPLRLLEINRDSPLIPEGFNQSNTRPIILAPTKLKLPNKVTNDEANVIDKKLEGVSMIVNSSDGESTSCDSSPKREPAIVKATLNLPHSSTRQKSQNVDQPYVHQDRLKSRDSWHDRATEAGCGYQTRNDSTNVGSCYGDGGSAGGGIRGQDEKANVVPAVALAMSSGEDSSDSECDPMAIRRDTDDRRNNVVVNETRSIWPNFLPFVDVALLGTSTPAPTTANIAKNFDDKNDSGGTKNSMAQKRDKRKRLHTIRRSLSEGGCGRSKCRCHLNNGDSTQEELDREEMRPSAFPSLTDVRLQESGIAKLSNNDDIGGNLSEADLERKYIALAVGLGTDRVTLPRRVALSIRQRDQSERNLTCEVQKMHQDIQDLAPLCIDRESVERVERVRHQLEMIAQCAFRVSCTAETLGAVHQENRISRAILLADRYLLVLRSRCAKLATDLSETKRILAENNIVVEEHNGELGDDMPRIRYRGMPTNNRTMMARRRASIATIFRPLGNFQDVAKEGLRQRNSVSGRVTLRRPSLTAESQKWETEKLDRTDSSSSIGELREIFEQAESRRTSREENNNNVLRLHSSNLTIRDCENYEIDVSTNVREELVPELFVEADRCHESRIGRRTPQTYWSINSHVPWKTLIVCIIISFFFGFFVQYAVSSVNQCSGKYYKWWSIEEIIGRYFSVKNDAPRPI